MNSTQCKKLEAKIEEWPDKIGLGVFYEPTSKLHCSIGFLVDADENDYVHPVHPARPTLKKVYGIEETDMYYLIDLNDKYGENESPTDRARRMKRNVKSFKNRKCIQNKNP